MSKVTDAPIDLSYDDGVISGSANPGWLIQNEAGENVYPDPFGPFRDVDLADVPPTAEGAAEVLRRLEAATGEKSYIEIDYDTLKG